jgi:hypothetical protein
VRHWRSVPLSFICVPEISFPILKTKKPTVSVRELNARLSQLHVMSGVSVDLHVWFAGVAYVTPWAVTRWLTGRRKFRGPVLALLERLECERGSKR